MATTTRCACAHAAILMLGALVTQPAAAAVTLDYTALGALTLDNGYYANCSVVATGSDALLVNEMAPGLAVQGGSDTALDGTESLSFQFNANGEPLTGREVRLVVAAEPGGDGDGAPAELSVEAFRADGEELGTAAFAGEGAHDLSAAFAGQRIASFRVTPDPDPVRILGVSFAPVGGSLTQVGFFQIGAPVASLSLCGVTLSGSDALTLNGSVGVLGGSYDELVDDGERLSVELAEASEAVRYRPYAGAGTPPFSFEAFDAGGLSLGTLALQLDTLAEFDLTALYGGAEIRGFDVLAGAAGLGGQALGYVEYAAPEPAAPALGAAACGALTMLARRRRG